jgi:hypothetical protein
MRAEHEDAEVYAGVSGQFTQRPVEVAIVGAGGGDDGDAALGGAIFDGRSHRRSIN